ncbi:MAG: glycosyltransferase family 2 protein [Pseudomonadota bacterium]
MPFDRTNVERRPTVAAIIPALNEEAAIGGVVSGISPFVDMVIVADNGSTDQTVQKAQAAGAVTVSEPRPGYGRACLAGVAYALDAAADIYLFLDGDGSDAPGDAAALLDAMVAIGLDLVIGSRALGDVEPGALTLPQRFGNWLACHLMTVIWKSAFTDLGPFRAIRRSAYERLGMSAPTYGWTVQMQVRALKSGLRTGEVAVTYRRRIGVSKISGTVRGVFLAGVHILGTIAVEALTPNAARPAPVAERQYQSAGPAKR